MVKLENGLRRDLKQEGLEDWRIVEEDSFKLGNPSGSGVDQDIAFIGYRYRDLEVNVGVVGIWRSLFVYTLQPIVGRHRACGLSL